MTAVNVVTGEIVDEAGTLTATEARDLTDRIRQTLTISHDLITSAYRGRAWVALGYETWDAYCSGEFAEARMVRLDREQRREIVAEMREAGMSTRAIASGLGVSHETVAADQRAGVKDLTPAAPVPVTGQDGKTYQSRPVAEPATPRQSSQRPLPDFAKESGWELRQAADRIARVLDDPRFTRNADQVTTALRGHLIYTAEVVSAALGRLS